MTESQISQRITKHIVKKYGGFVVNVITASKSGIPDLLVCIDGGFYFFEVKTATGRSSPLQDEQMLRLQFAGAKGGVVRSVEDVDKIIK